MFLLLVLLLLHFLSIAGGKTFTRPLDELGLVSVDLKREFTLTHIRLQNEKELTLSLDDRFVL